MHLWCKQNTQKFVGGNSGMQRRLYIFMTYGAKFTVIYNNLLPQILIFHSISFL